MANFTFSYDCSSLLRIVGSIILSIQLNGKQRVHILCFSQDSYFYNLIKRT